MREGTRFLKENEAGADCYRDISVPWGNEGEGESGKERPAQSQGEGRQSTGLTEAEGAWE